MLRASPQEFPSEVAPAFPTLTTNQASDKAFRTSQLLGLEQPPDT